MTRTTIRSISKQDRDQRVLATLAQQCGSVEDAFTDDGHAPDSIDAQALGHCRVTAQTAWSDGRPVAV